MLTGEQRERLARVAAWRGVLGPHVDTADLRALLAERAALVAALEHALPWLGVPVDDLSADSCWEVVREVRAALGSAYQAAGAAGEG